MCERFGEPKSASDLKRRIEHWNKKFVQNEVKILKMINMYAQIFMQYVTWAKNDKKITKYFFVPANPKFTRCPKTMKWIEE
jgi:hypothetical protein